MVGCIIARFARIRCADTNTQDKYRNLHSRVNDCDKQDAVGIPQNLGIGIVKVQVNQKQKEKCLLCIHNNFNDLRVYIYTRACIMNSHVPNRLNCCILDFVKEFRLAFVLLRLLSIHIDFNTIAYWF